MLRGTNGTKRPPARLPRTESDQSRSASQAQWKKTRQRTGPGGMMVIELDQRREETALLREAVKKGLGEGFEPLVAALKEALSGTRGQGGSKAMADMPVNPTTRCRWIESDDEGACITSALSRRPSPSPSMCRLRKASREGQLLLCIQHALQVPPTGFLARHRLAGLTEALPRAWWWLVLEMARPAHGPRQRHGLKSLRRRPALDSVSIDGPLLT